MSDPPADAILRKTMREIADENCTPEPAANGTPRSIPEKRPVN